MRPEGSREHGVAIADAELDTVCLIGEGHREIAGLLGHPTSDRVGGHAGDPHETRVVVDEHEDVEPAEEHSVDMEGVAGHQSLGLFGEELRPGRSGSPRRRVDAAMFQDRPDARGGDGDARGGELTVGAAVAPSRVLLRQAEDECGRSLGDGQPTGPAVRIRPAFGDEVPVPTQRGCRLDEEVPESPAGEQTCEAWTARTARSAGCSAGRWTWRRRTATSWRSMTTSMARSVSLRPISRMSRRTRQNAR
jgi:hypothetical protein